MVFLGTAFYDKTDNHLFGVVVNEYDKQGTTRMSVSMIDAEDLQEFIKNKEVSGFCVDNGMLLSDSPNYFICDSDKYLFFKQYINDLCKEKETDLIDFIKYLIVTGGYILPDFFETEKFTGSEIISVDSLKVSKSSITIYAPFIVDNTWETISLYDSTNLKPKKFFAAVPQDTDLTKFKNKITYIKSTEITDSVYDVYACELDIIPCLEVSAGFINYLAFRVAEGSIYCKILDRYLASIYNNMPKQEIKSKPSDGEVHKKKENIEAIHSMLPFTKYKLAFELAEESNASIGSETLELVVNFIRHLQKQITESGDVLKVCGPLHYNLREELLNNDLELLAVRYGLFSFLDGKTLETTAMKVKGGGVFGDTILKKVGGRL